MQSQTDIRTRIERVTSYPIDERERIYRKYFATPSATVRFLCSAYDFDQKAILDVGCHYGYHLIHFGAGSQGLDASPQYLRYAQEMGLAVQEANIEERFPAFDSLFDGLFFSGTLEEVLSPHVILMRFRSLLKPDGLLCLRVPTVPPLWFDRLIRLRSSPGYAAAAHLYFFTPRLLTMLVKRAGYDIVQVVSTGVWENPWLRPLHGLLLPLTTTVTIMARPQPDFLYPEVRAMRFLPDWASDLAPYHRDFQKPGKS